MLRKINTSDYRTWYEKNIVFEDSSRAFGRATTSLAISTVEKNMSIEETKNISFKLKQFIGYQQDCLVYLWLPISLLQAVSSAPRRTKTSPIPNARSTIHKSLSCSEIVSESTSEPTFYKIEFKKKNYLFVSLYMKDI